MVASTRIIDYLGIDIEANLPDPMTFTISPGAIAFYWASDTDVLWLFDQSVPEWVNVAESMAGQLSFTTLLDTPAAYTGEGGKALAVTVAEDGVEFVDFPSGLPAFAGAGKVLATNITDDGAEWIDPPESYPDFTGNMGKILAVNATEDGVEWIDAPDGGGGGSYWEELVTWDGSVDSPVSELISPLLTDYDDVMVVFANVTTSASAWRAVQFSRDGGSTWDAAGSYVRMNNTGTVSSSDNTIYSHTTSASAARTSHVFLPSSKSLGPKKFYATAQDGFAYFFMQEGAVDRVRAYAESSGNFNGGRITIYGRKRGAAAVLRPWYFAPPAAADFTLATGSGTANLTLTDDADVGLRVSDANAPATGDDWRLAYKALPAGVNWEVTMRWDIFLPSLNYAWCAIGVRDSISGRLATIETVGADARANSELRRGTYTAINGAFNAKAGQMILPPTIPPWFRIQYTHGTTTIVWQYSMDGKNWATLLSESATAYLSNLPDQVFFGMAYARASGPMILATIDHWSQSW